jgi:hypothetical protein
MTTDVKIRSVSMSGKNFTGRSAKLQKQSIQSLAQSVQESIKRGLSQQQTSSLKVEDGIEMDTEEEEQASPLKEVSVDNGAINLPLEAYQTIQVEITALYKLIAEGIQVEWAKAQLDNIRDLLITRPRPSRRK